MILPASLSGRAIVEGVDLSQYQQGVDYRAVVASGKRFGFVRVADGDSHPDPTFFTHRDGLLDAQRNLSAVERNAVLLRGDRAVTTVALIRSLGGGWE